MDESMLEHYKGGLRADVCSICANRSPETDAHRYCRHETDGNCPLFAKLPTLATVLSGVSSENIDVYEQALFDQVCKRCPTSEPDGFCAGRDAAKAVPDWCIIDAYFPQVVGAIERIARLYAKE